MSIKAAGFRYIPKGAMKIADKNSDAVAYFYNTEINGTDRPAVRIFFGKQAKPVLACWFAPFGGKTGEQQRADRVAKYFKSRQEVAAYRTEQRAKRKAAAADGARKVEAGTYYYSSWGYEQTNIDWYRVEKLIGKTMAQVVQVKPMDASDGNAAWMTGKSIPSEEPKGEPFKVRLNGDGFKVGNQRWAYRWDGQPKNWTAYA